MPKITANKIIFDGDDWTGGLNEQYGSVGLLEGSPIQTASNFNPYRPHGVAAPGFLASDVTNVSSVTSAIVSGINKYNSGSSITKGLLLQGNTGTIHELTYSTNTITTGGAPFPYVINHGHANEVGEDIVAYSVGTTRYAFYSFRDDTDWDIGRYDYATTFVDNYMSTTATGFAGFASIITAGKSAPHPMIVGADDILYVGDRNLLHGFDGQVTANGTIYTSVLTLPAGYTITSFAKNENFLIIYAYRQDQTDSDGAINGQATAFFWDYLSLDPTKVIDLDDNFVNGGFTWKGTPCCFTTGRPSDPWLTNASKLSDLRIFNGTEFESVASFDGSLPIYRGVDVVSNEIMWNSGGTVFSYGERKKGDGFKLNKMTSGTGTTSAFLKTMTSTQQYISSGSTTSGGLQYFGFTTFTSSSSVKTIFYDVPTQIGQINRVTAVEIHLYSLGNANNTLTVNLEYLGNATGEQTVVSQAVFANYNVQYKQASDGSSFLSFSRIGVQLAWNLSDTTSSPPRVDKIIIYYEPKNI